MQYRRVYVPGGSYFFTVVTERRRKILVGKAIEALRQSFRRVMATHPFRVDAAVVLPDHLHCIWTLPPEDHDFSTRWRLIKTWFTKHCDHGLRGHANPGRRRKSQQAIWQHRFWEHLLRDEDDYVRHVEYIHFNPVKHGYVQRPHDWPYSSFRIFVRKGFYEEGWGAWEIDFPDNIGME